MSDTDKMNANSQYLLDTVKERFGNRLSTDEFKEVEKIVKNILKGAELLRSVKLENSDEPFNVFIPY